MAEMTPHARLTNQMDALSSAIARDRAVTVLMPTLNGAAFILEQLQSLATQTLLPTRLVVSDDGSRDATLAKIADFAHVAPFPITILRGPGQGVAANVLSLLASAPPGAVALCDQDDVWLPEKLARARGQFATPCSSVDTLQHWILLRAAPICSCCTHQFKCRNIFSRW